ncbi:MAG: hypothetical protein CW742_12445 [Methanoregula sp.]|nr:MAG: hypothetical protein CW742_12445 [Methanoregula sp.]
MDAVGCVLAEECVPARGCHPTSCINRVDAPDCSDPICTMSCEGPLDCGAGTCGCGQGTCTVIPAPAMTVETVTPAPSSSSPIRIWATPNRYSPMMSSTPGLELSLITPMDTDSSTMAYDWTAGYGFFLSWNPPDYAVNERGASVTTGGGKIYWSFRDKPASTATPVTITMTARDTATKKEIGRSVLTLDWDGDTAVIVRQIA